MFVVWSKVRSVIRPEGGADAAFAAPRSALERAGANAAATSRDPMGRCS
jgi:hypothetical protein